MSRLARVPRPLRIAQVAPVATSIPPIKSGSIETMTALLSDGLVSRGHHVTLFATGNSVTKAALHATYPRGYTEDDSLWPWELCELFNVTAAVERAAAFDVITMWQSLEHVHEPHEVLCEARRLLAPGGKLIIATPNIDSLPFRWFGHAWYGLDLPRHLTHFAPWTLRLMLHRAGFRVGRIRMVRHSSWLRSSAQAACREPYSNTWHRWLRKRTPSTIATWFSYLTRQCDCMTATAWRR